MEEASVSIAESHFDHLVNFTTGDRALDFYYRSLSLSPRQDNNFKDKTKLTLGCCVICGAALPVNSRTRIQPLQRMTKTILKLMTKTSKKIPLTRFENFKLKKFLQSSQQMVVKCSNCDSVVKKIVIQREDLIKLKDKQILTVENAEKQEDEGEPEKLKKRKRKKKKKKETRRLPNSLLSDDESKEEQHTPSFISTPVTFQTPSTTRKISSISLRDFVRSETKDTSSSAIFQRAINAKALTMTPLRGRMNDSAITQNSAKSAKTATSSLTQSKKKSSIHKDLKKFLSSNPVASEEKTSLQDFLTMLS